MKEETVITEGWNPLEGFVDVRWFGERRPIVLSGAFCELLSLLHGEFGMEFGLWSRLDGYLLYARIGCFAVLTYDPKLGDASPLTLWNEDTDGLFSRLLEKLRDGLWVEWGVSEWLERPAPRPRFSERRRHRRPLPSFSTLEELKMKLQLQGGGAA